MCSKSKEGVLEIGKSKIERLHLLRDFYITARQAVSHGVRDSRRLYSSSLKIVINPFMKAESYDLRFWGMCVGTGYSQNEVVFTIPWCTILVYLFIICNSQPLNKLLVLFIPTGQVFIMRQGV